MLCRCGVLEGRALHCSLGRILIVQVPHIARLAFRVDAATAPAFHAWVEDYHFESDGSDGTLLRVAMGGKPRLAFKLATPVLPRALTLLMTRAGHNIERGGRADRRISR